MTTTTRRGHRPRPLGYWSGPGRGPRPTPWGDHIARFAQLDVARRAATDCFDGQPWGWTIIPEAEATPVTTGDHQRP